MPRPACLLLDTNIVLRAHSLGIWNRLKSECTICLPGVVVEECKYYCDNQGRTHGINLKAQVQAGQIRRLDADTKAVADVASRFVEAFLEGLHAGELEALGLILSGQFQEGAFCTADTAAIEAIAMLGLADHVVSFERAIRELGLPRQHMPRYFREDVLQHHIRVGQERRITGEYLREGHR